MWSAENISAVANSVQACVALMTFVVLILANKESGMSKPRLDTTAESTASTAANSTTNRSRRRSNVGLVCMAMGLGNLSWLQFGTSSAEPLSVGAAASIAVSISLLLVSFALLFRD